MCFLKHLKIAYIAQKLKFAKHMELTSKNLKKKWIRFAGIETIYNYCQSAIQGKQQLRWQ